MRAILEFDYKMYENIDGCLFIFYDWYNLVLKSWNELYFK